MDIKDKISAQDKKYLIRLYTEANVLRNLVQERDSMLQQLTNKIAAGITPSHAMYDMYINPATDTWELRLKPSVLSTQLQGVIPSDKAIKGN